MACLLACKRAVAAELDGADFVAVVALSKEDDPNIREDKSVKTMEMLSPCLVSLQT